MRQDNVLVVDARKFRNPVWMFRNGDSATREEVQRTIYKTFFLLFETAEEALNPISKKLLYWMMASWIVHSNRDADLMDSPGRSSWPDGFRLYDMLDVYQDMGFEAPISAWEELYVMPVETVEQRRQKKAAKKQTQKYIKKCYDIVEPLGRELTGSEIKYKDGRLRLFLSFCLGLDSCQARADADRHFTAILPRARIFLPLERYYPTVRKWIGQGAHYGCGFCWGANELADFLGAN